MNNIINQNNTFEANNGNATKHPRCLYDSSLDDFLNANGDEVFGRIVKAYHGVDLTNTNEAWEHEIVILQNALLAWKSENAHIAFEYDIPRLGKRIDVVLMLRGIIFCLEFKVGKNIALQADVEQVLDYALDLKNFHYYSKDRVIVPILIPTTYNKTTEVLQQSVYDDRIYNPLVTGIDSLPSLIESVIRNENASPDKVDWAKDWLISPYKPTPTIVEAARTLYENHSVEDITRHEADDVSTDQTIDYILNVIKESKEKREKSICFVTGVPGAGKTLVGLDVAIKQSYKDGEKDRENGAVYLSGNGPLVAVLTEALAIDNKKKCNERGEKKNLSDSRREVGEFLQIIHRYRDNMLAKIKNPVENGKLEIDPDKAIKMGETGYGEVEHVAIFDEAQRSWTHKRLADYLKRGGTYGNKLKVPNFPVSEASFLIWSLDQREDWAVIVCLVGGGQEINTGEAGISEWIEALNTDYKHWNVYISNKLNAIEYAEGKVNELLLGNKRVTYSDSLHLAVSLRSFRAETLSAFVHSLLTFSNDAPLLYKDVDQKGVSCVFDA
ncbi:DNA/RNA helicase domain-containing protein [Segatella paludivivens]|uniref:DNA/RNA helicase domain-containing protein n=1 Tax=Segatella paludivivens TaxID=185294 RepID=UPI0006940AD8|nr:DNA/RNA helicase domain-containing protein [Segatella paludivivens]